MKQWSYILTIDHIDGNWTYKNGDPVITKTETYRSNTLEGITKQYEKHNYSGSLENYNCRYLINGRKFIYESYLNKIILL